jgi:hypothetical protein
LAIKNGQSRNTDNTGHTRHRTTTKTTTQKANKDEQHEPNHNRRWTYVASGTTIFRLDFGQDKNNSSSLEFIEYFNWEIVRFILELMQFQLRLSKYCNYFFLQVLRNVWTFQFLEIIQHVVLFNLK